METLTNPFFKFIVLLFLVIVIVFFLSRKLPKGELAKHYVITKKTLAKWVHYFPCSMSSDEWKKKRKITNFEMGKIKEEWGDDVSMVLSKKQMAHRMGCDLKGLSRAVKCKLHILGLSADAWENCRVFPPEISKRITEIA